MTGVQTAAGLDRSAGETVARRGGGPAPATIVVFLATMALMPLAYGYVAFHGHWVEMAKPKALEHIAFNLLANALVMLTAIPLNGRMDQKLTGVFTRVLTAHGALAFYTLISRHYYSIPMLVLGGAASAVLGVLVVLIQGRSRRLRVGVLGPWAPILDRDPNLIAQTVTAGDSTRGYDLLLVTLSGDPPPAAASMLSRALVAGKRVRHIAEFLEEAQGSVAIEHFDLDHLPEGGLTTYRTGKRMFDVLAATAMLPFLLPMIGVACLVVFLSMGAPVFFTQDRVGQGGKVFRIFKLRTMRPDPQDGGGVATAVADNRITPVGRWLRRFHVDELPQIFNVLAGDMSLVGPRPEQPGLTAAYIREVPAFAYRQLVRPGITGWAQVRAGYAADLEETRVKLGYDLFYLKNFSFGLDVQILARTVWTLLVGGGVR